MSHRTDEDAEYAHQMMKDEMLRKNEKSINDEEDARLAKMIERQEMEHLHRLPSVFRCSSDGLELVSRLPSGPNAEHRQLQIDIKDSPVRGATGHVAH